MRRRLLMLAAVVSLLSCAATVTLWVRSFSVMDEAFLVYRTEGAEHVAVLNGRLLFQHIRPNDGIRGAVERVSHRATPVEGAPPHPWFTQPSREVWGVSFLNVPAPTPREIQQARQLVKNKGRSQPIGVLGDDGRPTPDSIKAAQKWFSTQGVREDRAAALLNNLPTYWAIAFPLWSVVIITLIAPSTLLLSPIVRSHWRRRRSRCTGCGYNLIANTSGTCPECGTPVPQASRSA